MNQSYDWLYTAVKDAKAASPMVTDAVAKKLSNILTGAFREQELSPKQVKQTAIELLEAMEPHAPLDGDAS